MPQRASYESLKASSIRRFGLECFILKMQVCLRNIANDFAWILRQPGNPMTHWPL